MTTKSVVVNRLSSGFGQLVNVITGHRLEHSSVYRGDRRPQDRISNSVESSGGESYGAETADDIMSMNVVRATFPPGKRRRSCVAATTSATSTLLDKDETGKSQPDEEGTMNMGVAGSGENGAQRASTTPFTYSRSFDLGVTQPGYLATWRITSRKVRLPSSEDETDQLRLSNTSSDGSSYCGGSDCTAMTNVSGGSINEPLPSIEENQTAPAAGVEDIFSGNDNQVDELVEYNPPQEQEHGDMSLQQSRRRSEAVARSGWYGSSRRARRRWSDMIVVPNTPPCSPSSPDWFNPRFTPEAFSAHDLPRRFVVEERADSLEKTTDDSEQQVRCFLSHAATRIGV